jgi:hypothetical protein
MKSALRILVYAVCSPLIVFGTVLVMMTLMGRLLGGPQAPPSGMSWAEFEEWTGSGRWFRESMFQGIGFMAIPLLAVWGVNRGTRK